GTPDTCKPSSYSELFKSACPHAYSYAYDDKTSTFTCAGADYHITFCPPPSTSQKSSTDVHNPVSSNSPALDSTMVYEGALAVNGASTRTHMLNGAVAVAVAVATWPLCHLFF
ncbi:thaumatin family protein, partial [Klebsiella pneumoniae]